MSETWVTHSASCFDRGLGAVDRDVPRSHLEVRGGECHDGQSDAGRASHSSAWTPVCPRSSTARPTGRLDKLRLREKALTKESDAVAAARRRLPMVEVDPIGGDRGERARSRCSRRSNDANS